MQLGEIIRTYRKSRNMTQEELAVRLGVTASAVNKWEKGNSLPDIMLLAPIARLLGITTDELLSFREDLTVEEINAIVWELDAMLKEKPYGEVFDWAKRKICEFPNCEGLIWQIAVILDAQRMVQEIDHAEEYDDDICSYYVRALESRDETIRNGAADSLFGFYLRKKEYDKAEKYLDYFSKENPERKRKLARLYSETGRIGEAYKAYEELLFADYQMINGVLHGMYLLALQDQDYEKAHMFVDKQEMLAKCFEMGKYYEASNRLEIATLERNADEVITIMEDMLSGVKEIGSFCRSPLYEHMQFKEVRREFREDLRKNLLQCFRDEETYGFLKGDERWREILSIESRSKASCGAAPL